MPLPNFFIVGSVKSGTSSLYQYLKQHPDVFLPEEKEPGFFVDWKGFVQDLGDYQRLFSPAGNCKALGEATTAYLFDKNAPNKIKALVAEARILIILRNPVEMAFSLWRMGRRNGPKHEPLSFRRALQEEHRRMSDTDFQKNTRFWPANFYYFNRGLYAHQVERYLDSFGREKVGIYLFEELKDDPVKLCQDIFRFLNVDPDFIPVIEIHNKGSHVRHRGLHKFLMRGGSGHNLKNKMKKPKPDSILKRWLKTLNQKPPPQLDEGLRRELCEKFAPDIQRLEKLIGKDLSVWR